MSGSDAIGSSHAPIGGAPPIPPAPEPVELVEVIALAVVADIESAVEADVDAVAPVPPAALSSPEEQPIQSARADDATEIPTVRSVMAASLKDRGEAGAM